MTDTDKDKIIALLRAEVRAWRDWKKKCEMWPPEACECKDKPRGLLLATAMKSTDAANALEES